MGLGAGGWGGVGWGGYHMAVEVALHNMASGCSLTGVKASKLTRTAKW